MQSMAVIIQCCNDNIVQSVAMIMLFRVCTCVRGLAMRAQTKPQLGLDGLCGVMESPAEAAVTPQVCSGARK